MKQIQFKQTTDCVRKGVLFMLPAIIAITGLTTAVKAQNNLLVTPYRLVFEKGSSIKEITIANTGKETTTYTITPKQLRMKEAGGFEYIDEPDQNQHFASDHIRYFPKKVTLAPNKTQVIKVEVLDRDKLAEGEYRSHLSIRAVAKNNVNARETVDTAGINVKLTPSVGIIVPVIIRAGTLAANVQLTNASFTTDNNIPQLNVVLNREGNMSVYGDIKVEHIAANGQVTNVAIVKGIAVYTPNATRKIHVDLNKTSKVDYSSGTLKVVYMAQRTDNNKVLAETILALK